MTQRQASGHEMHDTVETTALSGKPSATPTAPGTKVCCACGKDVAGQKRFKDAEGRYWCYDCVVEDHIRKHPEDGIACAECGAKFSPSKLLSFEDDVYCEGCLTKKKAQKKREHARIVAAAEEARAQEKRRKLLMITVTILALLAVAWAIWTVIR